MGLQYLNQLIKLSNLKRGTTKHVPLDVIPQYPCEVPCLKLESNLTKTPNFTISLEETG